MVDPVNPNISGIGPRPIDPGKHSESLQKTSEGKSFRDVFNDQIGKVNDYLLEANKAQEDLATGRTDNVDEVFAEVKKADLHFQMLMQIRNKLIDAYEQITQMRI